MKPWMWLLVAAYIVLGIAVVLAPMPRDFAADDGGVVIIMPPGE